MHIMLCKINKMDLNSLVSSRIRTIRLSKNISQKDVASAINLSETAYSRIENGITQLTIAVLVEICQKLNCKIEEVLDIEGKKIANNQNNLILSQFNEGTFHVSVSPNDFIEMTKHLDSLKKNQNQ
jgi:transcriptional regulator with XRE-family HTH domain